MLRLQLESFGIFYMLSFQIRPESWSRSFVPCSWSHLEDWPGSREFGGLLSRSSLHVIKDRRLNYSSILNE